MVGIIEGQRRGGRKVRVLLVEDNPGDARLVGEALADAGGRFLLDVVERLSTGLARLARGGVDVVLLDLQLPDSTGLATFDAIHEAAQDIPIVVFTSVDDTDLGTEAVQRGAQDYMPKDRLEPDLLAGRLVYAVERQRRMLDATQGEADIRDAYERERERVERLEDLDRLKNTFLGAVAHDLRTPLSVILGAAETLQTRADLMAASPQARELVDVIASNANRLDALLRDLLDLDRFTRGVTEPDRRSTDVPRLLRTRVAEAALGDHMVEIDEHPLTANLDPTHLERIVDNLLQNAARHTPPGTRVWVGATRRDEGLEIVVEDDGPGFERPSCLDEVFEPFVRADDSPGTGIGLSLVAALADLHGGRAWAEERDGGGASFHVLVSERPRPAPVQVSTPDPQRADT